MHLTGYIILYALCLFETSIIVITKFVYGMSHTAFSNMTILCFNIHVHVSISQWWRCSQGSQASIELSSKIWSHGYMRTLYTTSSAVPQPGRSLQQTCIASIGFTCGGERSGRCYPITLINFARHSSLCSDCFYRWIWRDWVENWSDIFALSDRIHSSSLLISLTAEPNTHIFVTRTCWYLIYKRHCVN